MHEYLNGFSWCYELSETEYQNKWFAIHFADVKFRSERIVYGKDGRIFEK